MLSQSYLNLLNLDDSPGAPSPRSVAPRALPRLPRVITEPGMISDYDQPPFSPSAGESPPLERRIVVSHQLPLKCRRDSDAGEWLFELDNDALVLQLKDGFPPAAEVWFVGTLKVEIDPSEQDAVSALLVDKFRCLPAFIPPEVHNRFYHGFCKHYLWPLFHYKLPISPNHGHGGSFGNGVGYRPSDWQAYVSANMIFADKIMEVVSPDEDFIWMHDYHLMVLPTILRRRFHRMKLGFFLHSPFPSSEIYRTIPVREEILKSLLNADLVGFHTFDYARHFLSCCRRMLGLEYKSRRGYIGLEYYGRTVSIKILPVGIHMGQLQSLLSLPETANKVKELKEEFPGKVVIVGVDDMDVLKGISFKFWAMGKLLELNPQLRGKAVMVQIANPPRSRGKDVQEVQLETHSIADEINSKYGEPEGYKPIVFIDKAVSSSDKAAYYAISDCCMVNAVRDGMNLVPYEYTVCRQGSRALEEAAGICEPRTSMIIVSEFIGCSPSLSGAIRVNPWNVECLAEAMCDVISIPKAEKELRHEKHYNYINSHDVAYWARSFDQDLKRACSDHSVKRFSGMGFGWGFRVIALGPHFRRLKVDHIVSAYAKAKNRLFLLDCDGTIKPESSVDKEPSKEVISVLNSLCSDPNNVVFIVSGRERAHLSNWFSSCEKLGLSAEHGFLTRWNKESEWVSSIWGMDFEWKKIVMPIMKLYMETTDGSYIEEKESALVWHHGAADPDFASCQSKELLDHLENVLANEPVVVKRSRHTVEVKPQGVNKGVLVEKLMETMRQEGKSPDFMLCIGDDRSDEDMFESIARWVSNPSLPAIAEVFACTVGQKPSMAKYYLDDTTQVVNLLQGVAKAASLQSSPVKS
ncbi:hypothetical protein V2J09_018853 [Rumex salicifolius]